MKKLQVGTYKKALITFNGWYNFNIFDTNIFSFSFYSEPLLYEKQDQKLVTKSAYLKYFDGRNFKPTPFTLE